MKLDLSKPDVVKAIPSDQDGLFPDAAQDGLYIRVQRKAKSWTIRYAVDGVKRQKSMPLTQPYKAARDLTRELRLEAKRGRDVVAERREELAARREKSRAERARSGRLLGKVVGLYLADAETKLRPATMRETRRYLQTVLAPLHDHDADTLDVRAVASVLATVAQERGRTSANRARAYLSACLSFGVATGLLERNILIGTKRPQPEQQRDRVLDEAELSAVWLASDPSTDYGAIVRLLVLTGQRREEVGAMRWSELDLDRGLWTMQGERTKNHRAHVVPLSAQAVALLADRKRVGERDAVFGRSVNGTGFAGWSARKHDLDASVALPEWRLHDLRRSVVTGMAEIGIAPQVIEAVVNHISGHKAGVAGVYNKAAYLPERRAALQRWADHLEGIVAGEPAGNVVAFGR
jgi:integrase